MTRIGDKRLDLTTLIPWSMGPALVYPVPVCRTYKTPARALAPWLSWRREYKDISIGTSAPTLSSHPSSNPLARGSKCTFIYTGLYLEI